MSVTPYSGTLPTRTQSTSAFNLNAEAWVRWFTSTAIPGINDALLEYVAIASAVLYDSGTTYNPPDVVIGSDGARYPCIGTDVVGDDPVGSVTGNWGNPLVMSLSDVQAIFPGKNLLYNALGRVNQEAVSGTVTLAAGEFGHDGWMAGAAGCTYTFSTTGTTTTFIISAGSLIQIVESNNNSGGSHALSWEGTAQARIDSGAYSASGITSTLTAGVQAQVEFATGTFSRPQFERGGNATVFEYVPIGIDQLRCYRYYYVTTSALRATKNGYDGTSTASGASCIINFKVTMASSPVVTGVSVTNGTYTPTYNIIGDNSACLSGTATSISGSMSFAAGITFDSRLS